MAQLFFPPVMQIGDANGDPYSGAKAYFYQTGTTTPITTYQDSGLVTPHANPVVADTSGRFAPIYISDTYTQYKVVIKTSADVTLVTVDPVTLVTAGVFTSATISGLLDISAAAAGQIKFPAAQNVSTNANTLDDYEEGSWTPVLTFVTPGDLSVAYSAQLGRYQKVGNTVRASFQVATSAFTHTTASGNLRVTGLPFPSTATIRTTGPLEWSGITKATYTSVVCVNYGSDNLLHFMASGSAVASSLVTSANVPTGGTVILIGEIIYDTSA